MLNTLSSLRAACVAVAAFAAASALPALADTPETIGHVKGSADAPVTIVEFASVTCSHCKHFNDDLMPMVQEEFIDTGKIRLEFREYALNSVDVAIYAIAECAGEESFFPIVEEVFAVQQKLIKDAQDGKAYDYLIELAGRHGLETEEDLDACLSNPDMRQRLMDSMATGDEAGVTGTPSFLINGQLKRADSDFNSVDSLRAYLNRLVDAAAEETMGE